MVTLYKTDSGSNFIFAIFFFLSIQLTIYADIKKYLKEFKKIILTICVINLANIAYVFGSILAILNLKNLISRKFYLKSRKNK